MDTRQSHQLRLFTNLFDLIKTHGPSLGERTDVCVVSWHIHLCHVCPGGTVMNTGFGCALVGSETLHDWVTEIKSDPRIRVKIIAQGDLCDLDS